MLRLVGLKLVFVPAYVGNVSRRGATMNAWSACMQRVKDCVFLEKNTRASGACKRHRLYDAVGVIDVDRFNQKAT